MFESQQRGLLGTDVMKVNITWFAMVRNGLHVSLAEMEPYYMLTVAFTSHSILFAHGEIRIPPLVSPNLSAFTQLAAGRLRKPQSILLSGLVWPGVVMI